MEEIKQNLVKELPYGIQDFVTIMEQNFYYVDKTMYIPKLEREARNLFFIRPCRFGKSLMINMLRAYYDVNMKERFPKLFGNLWIGKQPTPYQGVYQVMYFDFSKIGGKIEDLEENFNAYCNLCLDNFIGNYKRFYSPEFVQKVLRLSRAVDKLNAINMEAHDHGLLLYLIVDEYDNFTNVVLNEHGEKVYWALTLDDLTSGFNIGWHISIKKNFNQMLGFSEEDVRDLLTYYKQAGEIRSDEDVETMIEDMKPWYDNYCFSEAALKTQSKVFNCDMVLYYVRNYMEMGEAPKQMLAPNTKTDYNKMKKLLQLDKLDGDRKGVLRTIIENGEIVGNIEESFPARELTKPDIFISLLFYYGMLTIKDTFGDQLLLTIPNNNVRKQYYNYLLEQYQDENALNTLNLKTLFTYMAFNGKWQDALEYMAKAYAEVSSVRDGIEAERNLQGFFMAYLSLNNYYYTAPELELNHGYCDFFLLPDLTHYATKHSYILELKVLSKKEWGEEQKVQNADGTEYIITKAEKQWRDAEAQIRHYAIAPRVEALRQGTQLHKIIMQFEGWELKRMSEIE